MYIFTDTQVPISGGGIDANLFNKQKLVQLNERNAIQTNIIQDDKAYFKYF